MVRIKNLNNFHAVVYYNKMNGGYSMVDTNCIFCKIAAGDIPSATIYEDERFRAIMDISPASKGHAIILPKNHAADLFSLEEAEAREVFVVAKKVATAMKEVLGCEGVNILQNNGEVAGQTVFHLHVHVIPRYKGDEVVIKWPHKESYEYDFGSIAKELAAKI